MIDKQLNEALGCELVAKRIIDRGVVELVVREGVIPEMDNAVAVGKMISPDPWIVAVRDDAGKPVCCFFRYTTGEWEQKR